MYRAGTPARDAGCSVWFLQVPPALGRAAFTIWWGDSTKHYGASTLEGGDDADRQGHGADRHGRTHQPARCSRRPETLVAAGRRRARDRLPDAQEPRREDAPGHAGSASATATLLLCLPRGRRRPSVLPAPGQTATAASRCTRTRVTCLTLSRERHRLSCGKMRPAATSAGEARSSGTTATTSSRWSPASSSPTDRMTLTNTAAAAQGRASR